MTTPPIRVPVRQRGDRLACTIAIAGKGQTDPHPFLMVEAALPASDGNGITPVREGQAATTPRIFAVHADGRQELTHAARELVAEVEDAVLDEPHNHRGALEAVGA